MKVNPAEGLNPFLCPVLYSGLGYFTFTGRYAVTDYTAQVVSRSIRADAMRVVMLVTFWDSRLGRGKYIEVTPLGVPLVYRDVFDKRDFPAIWEGR